MATRLTERYNFEHKKSHRTRKEKPKSQAGLPTESADKDYSLTHSNIDEDDTIIKEEDIVADPEGVMKHLKTPAA